MRLQWFEAAAEGYHFRHFGVNLLYYFESSNVHIDSWIAESWSREPEWVPDDAWVVGTLARVLLDHVGYDEHQTRVEDAGLSDMKKERSVVCTTSVSENSFRRSTMRST